MPTESRSSSVFDVNPRYSRQIQLPGIGTEGQERLSQAKVLIVGVGGLGSPAAFYLAAAGIGKIGLIDDDTVSLSNLQRQILYETEAVGQKKVVEAKARLAKLNPLITIDTYDTALTRANARDIFSNYDVILDGTDNFKTRYLISEACLATGKPHVYGGIFRFEGQVAIFDQEGPCYRCLFPVSPDAAEIPNCSEAGVLGALPGIIGSTQALETLKYILKFPESRAGQLFVFDALNLDSRTMLVPKRADCDHSKFDERIESSVKELRSPTEASKTAVWIDVRSETEFTAAHHPGARNIPIARLADEASSLEKNKTYVVYCASGARSARAQELLARQGFNDVWSLKGGLVF